MSNIENINSYNIDLRDITFTDNFSEKDLTPDNLFEQKNLPDIKKLSGRGPGQFLAKRIITKKCYEKLSGKYPYIFAKPSHLRMFEYLALGTFCDRESKRLILSQAIIAEIEGETEALKNNRYSAIKFLEEFRTIFPGLAWSEHFKDTPRMVINSGLDEEDLICIKENLEEKRIKGTEKVMFRTGEKFSVKDMYENRKEIDKQFLIINSLMNLNEDQKKVIDYLESLDPKVFSRLFSKNLEETIKLKDNFMFDPTKPGSKPIQERILDYIVEYPKPHYHADIYSNTMRISPVSDNFLGLKRELRKSLSKGCINADLRSSQFAIIAQQYQSKKAKEFILSGKKLWNELSLFVKDEPICGDQDKAAFKLTIYSMAFGKSIKGCFDDKGNFHEGLIHILQPLKLEKMLEHPVIVDLLEKRKQWFAAIKKKGGWNNAYGIFQTVNNNRPVRAVAASVIQSIEFKIINGVFDIAKQYGEKLEFKIITFQHDGFLMVMNDKRNQEKIQKLLQEIVAKEAEKFKVITALEFEQL